MKKTLKAVLAALLVVCLLLPLAACGNNATTETKLKIAIPNDTTNEARALLLLQDQGLIKLKEGVGLSATKLDIEENPHNYDIQEVFVDGILKIGGRDYDALGNMLEKVAVLTKDVNVTFTVSADVDELPAKVKAFIK